MESVLRTLYLFEQNHQAEKHFNEEDWKASIDFMEKAMDMTFTERQNQETVWLDESQIRSGDILGSCRPTPLTALITYGAGGPFAHIQQFLWFDDGLYIVESTDPVIKRTPWREVMDEYAAAY